MKIRIQAQLLYKHTVGDALNWKTWFKAFTTDLLSIVLNNFKNVGEFQSIQNLNELLISVVVENMVRSGIKVTDTAEKIMYNLNVLAQSISGDKVFASSEDAFDLLSITFASFYQFQSFGITETSEDKSVNAHNCRKSAMLSQLFMLHKMIGVLKYDSLLSANIQTLFVKYA